MGANLRRPCVRVRVFCVQITVDCALVGKTWVFPCNRWLSKREDDGQTSRDLYTSKDNVVAYVPKVPYEVVVVTGDVRGAGTDANGERRTIRFL